MAARPIQLVEELLHHPAPHELPQPQLTGELLGFALSTDGSTVYIESTIESGLWRASEGRPDIQAGQRQGPRAVPRRAQDDDAGPELWACADGATSALSSASRRTTARHSGSPLMTTITSTNGLVACSASGQTSAACFTDANASACSCSGYQNYCSSIEMVNACLGCGQDGAPPPASQNARCGCAVVGGGGAAGFVAGCSVMAIA